jgi:hypothetical protein
MLSPLNWHPGGNGVAYGQVKNGKDIFTAASAMLQTYDEHEVTYAGAPVAQLLEEARRVVILGFGFDERNEIASI